MNKPDISVIIVNYNVSKYLEQCLHSVFKSTEYCKSKYIVEVIVVDNNSEDDSTEMVKVKFPDVNLIENKDNTGFSKANNKAIKESKGRYVLLLNPDTFIPEETFTKLIEFAESKEKFGSAGVKMLDANGVFAKESKRGIPTPLTSFYKFSGLSSLFPKSKKIGKYYMSYLDENKINETEVLSGAFMFIKKNVLDEIGYLDENFFMYGEDIDLSYRILKAGYKNFYFPEIKVVHYKGESSKQNSKKYIKSFYGAMHIFAKKHYPEKKILHVIINLMVSSFISAHHIKKAFIFKPLSDMKSVKNINNLIILSDNKTLKKINPSKNFKEFSVVNPEDFKKKTRLKLKLKKTEIWFDSKSISYNNIIEFMSSLSYLNVNFKNIFVDNNIALGVNNFVEFSLSI